MLNRLEVPARLVIRTCLGLFTAAVILLCQSAFWTAAVSGWVRAILIGTFIVAYFRPHLAMLFLAAAVPLGQVGSRTLDSNMRGAEAVVLAFLAGALVRGWILHRFRPMPSGILQIVSYVFGLVIAASCIEQLWFAQLRTHFPGPFLHDVLLYTSRRYLIALDGLDMIFSAMLLLEGMALMLYAVHYCREREGFAQRLVAMLMVGAVAAAAVNLSAVLAALTAASGGEPGNATLLQRWTVHIGDVNAAGSYFAMASFIGFGIGWRTKSRRVPWILSGVLAVAALWLTGSRTALIAAFLMMLILAVKLAGDKSTRIRTAIAVACATLILCGFVFPRFFAYSFVDVTASQAVTIRWLFLQTTWQMLRDQPLFGLGIGQYALWSAHFAPPEMINHYTRENAHNYFAQIAGELGVVGVVAFTAVLAAALWIRRRIPQSTPRFLLPLTAGLGAFILTWIGGHPLLVPEVAFPFWMACGIVPGVVSVVRMRRDAPIIAALVCVALLASVAPRVRNKSARIDFSKVTYGLSDGVMEQRGRLFAAARRSRLQIPLRARVATWDAPVFVDVFVDDRPAGTITLADPGWQDARIPLSENAQGVRRQIDLRVRDHERNVRVEVGKWEIISAPDA